MEKRNVELSIEKAMEWYKKGGELKEVALQAYKEEELKSLTYEYICDKLFYKKVYYNINTHGNLEVCENLPKYLLICPNNGTSPRQLEKLLAINKLVNVAKYLNDRWEPDWNNINQSKYCIQFSRLTDKIHIRSTIWIQSSEIYFKSKELAQKAIEILGEDTIKLILSKSW